MVVHVDLTHEPLHLEGLLDLVQDPKLGGVAVFLGNVRGVTVENGEIRNTSRIVYEAHEPMAIVQMRKIANEESLRFEANVAVVHRLSTLYPGDTAVICVAACAHRAAAFECCRRLIDRIKEDVPIWKREFDA